MRIRIGEPLYAEGEADAEEFTRNLMSAIALLSDMDLNGEREQG